MALKSWEAASAAPAYQNASPEVQAQMKQQYIQAGGTIPEAAPVQEQAPQESGLASTIGNGIADFAKGAAAGVSHDIARGVGGLVEMLPGQSATAYGKRIQQNADSVYQRHMQEAGNGMAAQAGATTGRIAGDIGAMIGSGGVAIPAIAAREMGNAYANQADDDKSLLNAGIVGGATFAANRILPGAGARTAEGLIGKGLEGAADIGRNALAGLKGGAVTGAAQALNAKGDDATLGDVLTGTVEGGATGAAFGGAFGAASNILAPAARKLATKLASTPEGVPPSVNDSAQANAIRGSEILADRDIPLLDSRLANNPDAQAAFGKTQADADLSRNAARETQTNARMPFLNKDGQVLEGSTAQTKDRIERGGKQLVSDVKTSLDDASKNLTNFKNTITEQLDSTATQNSPAQASALREELAQFNKFQKDFNQYKSAMHGMSDGEGVKHDHLVDMAQKAQDSFNSMPDYLKADFNQNFKGVDGFTEGFNPVAHANEFGAAFQQLKNMHPNFRNAMTNPTQGATDSLPKANMIGMAKAGLNALTANRARAAMTAEQQSALDATRQLAAGARRAETTVAASKAEMEAPPPPAQEAMPLEMSDQAPPPALQEAQEAAATAPNTSAPIAGSQARVEAYRAARAQREAEAAAAAQAEGQVPVDQPAAPVAPTDIAALQARVADYRRQQAAQQEPAAPEPVAVDQPQEQQIVAPNPDFTMARRPTRQVEEAPVQEVAPEVQPSPDQRLVQEPRRPTEEAPAPSEDSTVANLQQRQQLNAMGHPEAFNSDLTSRQADELIAAGPQETPRNAPDQRIVQEPRRPIEEAPVEEPTPEPTPAPEPAPKPEPDQGVVRSPKAAEKPAEAPKEETPKAEPDTKEASAIEQFKKNVAERQLKAIKDSFSTKEVQDKVTLDNMSNKQVLQQLKREDVAGNTEALRHAVASLNKARGVREAAQHEINVKELDRWSKKEGIDPKYVTEAINQKGLDRSLILGVNDIKVRATKAYLRDLEPPKSEATVVEETPKEPWDKQKVKFIDEVSKMHPDVQREALPLIEQRYKTPAQTGEALTVSETKSLWKKIYNAEERIHKKMGREAERAAAQAKAEKLEVNKEELAQKAEESKALQEANNAKKAKVANQVKLATQMDNIRRTMERVLKDNDVPESAANKLIDSHMDKHYSVTEDALPSVKYQDSITKAHNVAEKYAKEHATANPAQVEEHLAGESTKEVQEAKKVIEEVNKKVEQSGGKDKEDFLDAASTEMVERAEKALRDGEDVSSMADAAELLARSYGKSSADSYPLVRYPKLVAQIQGRQEMYPNNPEVWLSQKDADSLSKFGVASGNTLKTRIAELALGKRYDAIKLLSHAEMIARQKRLDAGESLNKIKLESLKGRQGALAGEEPVSQKVKIKRKTPVRRLRTR